MRMHYTSWDRSQTQRPLLLADAGPEEVAAFSDDAARVGSDTWTLDTDNAVAVAGSGEEYRLDGDRKKDDRLTAKLGGRSVEFVNEKRSDWVVLDAEGEKIGQFSGANSGVRSAIVEFDGPVELSVPEIVAVSWFARLILEARLDKKTTGIIATLAAASVVAIIAFLL